MIDFNNTREAWDPRLLVKHVVVKVFADTRLEMSAARVEGILFNNLGLCPQLVVQSRTFSSQKL
jgi:hypothetical protein